MGIAQALGHLDDLVPVLVDQGGSLGPQSVSCAASPVWASSCWTVGS
ncbi:hypothetical protein [Kineosporia sp. NBRC 101731]|nr:hypothetical protein [Kineosporia sp. NBRC 101731]